jgi:hypothetical protein
MEMLLDSTTFNNIWKKNNERNNIPELRNADLLTVPYPRIKLFKKSPIHSLPKLWNALDETKYQQKETTFKIAIKDKLFDEENFLQE